MIQYLGQSLARIKNGKNRRNIKNIRNVKNGRKIKNVKNGKHPTYQTYPKKDQQIREMVVVLVAEDASRNSGKSRQLIDNH